MVDIEAAWKIYTSNPDYVGMSKRAFAEVITSYESTRAPQLDEVDAVAKIIASELGYDWDTLYNSKQDWADDRGKRQDINVPFKPDFIDAAKAAIAAMNKPAQVDAESLIKIMRKAVWGKVSQTPDNIQVAIMRDALEAIRPYLRTSNENAENCNLDNTQVTKTDNSVTKAATIEKMAKDHWNYDNHASDGNRAWHHLTDKERYILIKKMEAAYEAEHE